MVIKASRRKRRLGHYADLKPVPPPKSVKELLREQGLLGKKVDYGALATAVWPTKEAADEFERYLDDISGRPSD